MRHFPAQAELLDMEPEEFGPFILRFLKSNAHALNRFNFFQGVPGGQIVRQFAEGWAWLEREGFIAPVATDQFGLQFFVTKKGERVVGEENFDAYAKASMFPNDLDPVVMRAVKPLFIRGDYDTAVFRAFKEVEVRVKKKSGLGNEYYGRKLMQKAFGPGGPLENPEATKGEKEALRELFAGALSFCKNPSSHREIEFENPREVIDMICLANQLLRIVGRLVVKP